MPIRAKKEDCKAMVLACLLITRRKDYKFWRWELSMNACLEDPVDSGVRPRVVILALLCLLFFGESC